MISTYTDQRTQRRSDSLGPSGSNTPRCGLDVIAAGAEKARNPKRTVLKSIGKRTAEGDAGYDARDTTDLLRDLPRRPVDKFVRSFHLPATPRTEARKNSPLSPIP